MSAKSSSSGVIDITTAINNGQTATIGTRLDAFELVWVTVEGADGAIATVKKGAATAAVAYYVAGPPVTQGCSITNANTSFTSTDSLTVAITGANATRVTLFCRYPDAYAYNLSISVA